MRWNRKSCTPDEGEPHQYSFSSAIVGVRTPDHLNDLERAGELELSDESIERLNDLFDTNKGRPIRTGKPAPEAYAW